MPTTPILGLTVPSLTEPQHMPNTIRPIVNSLDTRCVPRFTTTAFRDAAIRSPFPGMMCYVESYDELYIYRGTGWISSVPRIVIKQVDDPTAGTTTLRPDSELQMLVEANSKYYGELTICYTADDSSDIKIQMSGPAFATSQAIFFCGLANDSVSPSNHVMVDARDDFFNFPIAFGATAISNSLGARLKVVITTASTAGTIKLLYAKNLNGTDEVTMQVGSSLELWKVK